MSSSVSIRLLFATTFFSIFFVVANPASAETARQVDARFSALLLESLPLPGSIDELVVNEALALEVFLAPSDFPDSLLRFVIDGPALDFAVNLDLSTMQGEAIVTRVRWPRFDGRALEVQSGDAVLLLEPPDASAVPDISDEELRLEWFLRSIEGADTLRGLVFAVRLATASGQTLASWSAPPVPSGCSERNASSSLRCRASGVSRVITALSIEPSGRFIAISGGDLRPRIDLWERSGLSLGRRIAFPPWLGTPVDAQFSADGRWLVALDPSGILHRWNALTGGEHVRIDASARSFVLLGSGRRAVLADDQGGLSIRSIEDRSILGRLGARSARPISRVVSCHDGLRIAAYDPAEDGSVAIWDLGTSQVIGVLGLSGRFLRDLALDGGGEHLIVTTEEEGLLRGSVTENSVLQPWAAPLGRRCRGRLAVSPDDSQLACVLDHGIAIFELESGSQIALLEVDPAAEMLDAISFTPDSSALVAVGGGEIFDWTLPSSSNP